MKDFHAILMATTRLLGVFFGPGAPLRPQPRRGEVQLLQSNSDTRGHEQAMAGKWSYTFFLFAVIMGLFILSVRFKKLNFKFLEERTLLF